MYRRARVQTGVQTRVQTGVQTRVQTGVQTTVQARPGLILGAVTEHVEPISSEMC